MARSMGRTGAALAWWAVLLLWAGAAQASAPARSAPAAPPIGTELASAYPLRTECWGQFDSFAERTTGPNATGEAQGWGWDVAARQPVRRVVFVDAQGLIVGAGEGGRPRPDVANKRRGVTSELTGWQGEVPLDAGPLTVWGLTAQAGSACPLGPMSLDEAAPQRAGAGAGGSGAGWIGVILTALALIVIAFAAPFSRPPRLLLSSWRLPVGLLVALVATGLALTPWPRLLHLVLTSEAGLVENLTVAVSLWSAVFAAAIWRGRWGLPSAWIGWWFFAFAAGLILLVGEEISWGQQYFRWNTPSGYAAMNLQNETNLHNLYFVEVEAPAALLGLGVLLTGIAWPIWAALRRRSGSLGGPLGWIWPEARLWPSAAMMVVIWAVKTYFSETGLDHAPGFRTHWLALREGVELYLLLFVLLHLASVRARQRALGDQEGREGGLTPFGAVA